MNGVMESTTFAVAVNSYCDMTDEDLLLTYRESDDRVAFETLVERYERELFGYLRHYLGNNESAEDVFQWTFFLVHEKCHLFEEGRKFRPWLYRIATNQAIDTHRRNKQSRSAASIDTDYDVVNGWNPYHDQLISEETPAELASAFEQANQVRDAVEQLPEQLRQVLYLVYFQGMTYREAAERLDIPFGTVKTRLDMAIRKLNGVLAGVI
ncbi:MAG: sigma-70 family RNA polymerase sigma factor [Planctomycetaceae bacterium]|nr:sigma-70 family RNA polymerase sigma factor [Planctomycetaceae bacterium]